LLLAAASCSRANPLFGDSGGTGGTEGLDTNDGPGTSSLTTDPGDSDDCGGCGLGQACIDDVCTSTCGTGLRLCGDECVDVQSDGDHCGECDRLCDSPTVCSGADCRDECPDGTQQCDGGCPEIDHVLHCGGCNQPCLPGWDCVEGTCVCPSGTTDCQGICADKLNDPFHCGNCDVICESGSCVGGVCQCDAGEPCDGVCIDLNTDPLNCGRCGSSCDAMTETCQGRVCTCLPFFTHCGEECVYTESNLAHCGSCPMACDDGQVCSNGVCTTDCSVEMLQCNGLCVNPGLDPYHCGKCGNACGEGEACIDGTCQAYEIPSCTQCPCPECGTAVCCPLPTLMDQVLCTDTASVLCPD
jgi:hypothetical protein